MKKSQKLAKKVLFFTKKALKSPVFQQKVCQDIRTAPGTNYYFIVCFDLRKIREKMQKKTQIGQILQFFSFLAHPSCDAKIG